MEQPPALRDFGRSYISFTSSRVNHTPRLQLEAQISVMPASGDLYTCYMSHPCIAESMYLESGLIQEPPVLVTFALIPDEEVLVVKQAADGRSRERFVRRRGEGMPTFSGTPSTMAELTVSLRDWDHAEEMTDYAAIREASLGGDTIVARTAFEWDGSRVLLEYPVTTMNIAHGREAWQVDAGPLVLPVADVTGAGGALRLDGMALGYVIYNRPDRIEAAAWSIHGADPEPGYRVATLPARNQLFRVWSNPPVTWR